MGAPIVEAMSDGWPPPPEVRLFHDEEKCRRFVRERLGINPGSLAYGMQAVSRTLFEAHVKWEWKH